MDDLQWFENPDTGATFGFGEPMPESIVDQIKARKLRPCAPPANAASVSPETESEPKADGHDEDDDDTDAANRIGPGPGFEVLPELEPEPQPEKPRRGGRRTA